jgi:GntR family transcriptional regulator
MKDVDRIISDLKAELKEHIDDGKLLAGQRLPAEREYAEKLNVARSRVKKLFDKLAEEGYVYRVCGKGTFVRRNELTYFEYDNADMPDSPGLTAMLRAQGFVIENKVLTFGKVEESGYFEWRFAGAATDGVFALHRLRSLNDEPVIIEYTYFPRRFFEDADKMDFSSISLYGYMTSKGRRPEHFNTKTKITTAPKKEAVLLGLKENDPIFFFEYVGFDVKGDVVEYTESYTRTDKTDLKFTAVFAP